MNVFKRTTFAEFLPVQYSGCPKHPKTKQIVDYESYALKFTRHKDSGFFNFAP